MGTAIEIEMALDQAKRFEDELQLLFMQAGKVDVWNKIKARSASMDLEAAHEVRKAKAAAKKHKEEVDEIIEIVLASILAIVLLGGLGWGTYELINYCTTVGCSR